MDLTLTRDELDAAIAEENALMEQSAPVLAAQNQHLQQRVVLLRATVAKLEAEVAELRAAAEPDEPDEATP